jgi:hypothetical protein
VPIPQRYFDKLTMLYGNSRNCIIWTLFASCIPFIFACQRDTYSIIGWVQQDDYSYHFDYEMREIFQGVKYRANFGLASFSSRTETRHLTEIGKEVYFSKRLYNIYEAYLGSKSFANKNISIGKFLR